MKKIITKVEILTRFIALFFIGQIIGLAQAKSVEVPMKFRDGTPAIDVMVNGKGPFLFEIDTGGQGDARADTSLVEKLGLKKVGEVIEGDPSGKNNRAADLVGIDSIKIGDLEFRNLAAATRNYNRRSGGTKIDGVLGFELFKNHLLTLDYSAKIVRIEEGVLPKANGTDILDFENPRGILVVKLGIGDRTVKAHIDSGNANGGFILTNSMVEKSQLASEPRVVGQAQTVTNTFEIKEAKLKDKISFGGFEYTEPTVVYPGPSPVEANIGAMVLRDYALTFDQKNKRVKLDKKGWKAEPIAQKVTNAMFQDYVGQYGERTISDDGENLYIQRPNGQKLKLVEVAKDEYFPEPMPTAKIKFIRNNSGKITEINVLNRDGVWEKAKKD